jgi:isopentenyl diphosphate isomerase/L-lactate dehydrogenase-like FMN-dependent dehydrogenase
MPKRIKIMFKLISLAAVVGVVTLTVTQDASAGWRRRWRQRETFYAPAPVVTTAPAASVPAAHAPAVAQSGSGTTYRSYSYDSGTAPAYQVPAPNSYRQPAREPSQANFFRADRKMHGLSWYRNQ